MVDDVKTPKKSKKPRLVFAAPPTCAACGRPMPKAQGGRPSTYDATIAEALCLRLAEGEPLTDICGDDDMPSLGTVKSWVVNDTGGFSALYTRAREIGVDVMVEKLIDEARDNSKDWVQTDEGMVFDHNHVTRSRLIVDTIKWFVAKLAPRKYGDRLNLELSGSIEINHLTDEQLNHNIEDMLNQAGVPAEIMEIVRPYLTVIPLPTKSALSLPKPG